MISLAYKSIFAILLCRSVSVAAASSVESLYVLYHDEAQESQGCQAQTVVGMRALLVDQTYSIIGAQSSSCAEEMSCFVSSSSDACQSLSKTYEAYGALVPGTEEGTYFNCANASPSFSRCYEIDKCGGSSLYPSCTFDVLSSSGLAENLDSILSDDEAVEKRNDNVVYSLYYTDDQCSAASFAGLRGFLVDESGTQLPTFNANGGDDAIMCEDAMACLLEPEGSACSSLNPQSVAEITVGVEDSFFRLCVSYDAAEEQCENIQHNSCIESPAYPGCYFRLAMI